MASSLSNPKGFWSGKKVLITGHTGFTGSWMSLVATELGAKVFGYSDEVPTKPSAFEAMNIAEVVDHQFGDVVDKESLQKRIRDIDPEIIIHLAAQPLVRKAHREPYSTIQVNALGTLNLLEVIRENPGSLKTLLNVTTDKVYFNKDQGDEFKEDAPLGGIEPYSVSKACSEMITTAYRHSYFKDINILTARAGNIIGGGDWSEDRLLVDAAKAAANGEEVVIRNPHSTRPWQHVTDVIVGYFNFIEKRTSNGTSEDSVNLGPPREYCWTVGEIMNCFCELWGGEAKWRTESEAQAVYESKLLTLDPTLAKDQLGWSVSYAPAKAIEHTVNWYKSFYKDSSPEELRSIALDQFTGALEQ